MFNFKQAISHVANVCVLLLTNSNSVANKNCQQRNWPQIVSIWTHVANHLNDVKNPSLTPRILEACIPGFIDYIVFLR